MRYIVIAAALCVCAFGQTQDHGRVFLGPLNAGGATITIPAKITTSDPGTCSVGEAIFRSDLSAGANIKFCTSTNTWTAWSGGGGTTYTAGPHITIAGDEISVDTTNIAELDADNAYTGYNNLSGGSWRPPEVAFASLPSAASVTGKVYVVTDAATAGSCSAGSGSARSWCRSTGSAWESLGGSTGAAVGADNTFTGTNTFSGVVIGAIKVLKPGTINATATVPNNTAYQTVTGGAYTGATQASGDVVYHDFVFSKPATTRAMNCKLQKNGTDLVSTAIALSTSANAAIVGRITEIVTGASTQTTSHIQYTGGSNASLGSSARSASNTTPAYQWVCANDTSADTDDEITLVSWTILFAKVF
jgi:hypothetical protein